MDCPASCPGRVGVLRNRIGAEMNRTALKLAALPPVLVAGWLAIDYATKTMDEGPRDTAPAQSTPCAPPCCLRYRDRAPADKHLCRMTNYIGLFTDTPEECDDGAIMVGTRVTVAVVNKIRGEIGDSNMDADVDIGDFIDFVACLESTVPDTYPWGCLCPFDYDYDRDVDLADFAGFQVAHGSGNILWYNLERN